MTRTGTRHSTSPSTRKRDRDRPINSCGNVTDKWSIYLLMLKRYGKYTYICVKPNAVPAIKKQWRECEELGEIDINGEKAVQMLCYFGSSTYNTKEFSHLLDGVISEMDLIGLETPGEKELERAVEQWEKNYEKNQSHHQAT